MADEFAYVGKNVTDLSTVTQADAGAVAPGDFVIFGEGNQTITSGLTTWNALSSGAGADGLDQIIVRRPFTGNIGSGAAGSLAVDVSYGAASRVVYDAGGGSFFLTGGTVAGTIDRIDQTGFGKLYLTGGTTTNYEQLRGYTNFNDSAVVTNAYVLGGTMDVGYNASGVTLLQISNGAANIQRAVTTLTMMGGAVVTVYRVDSSATKPTATTINLFGGTLNWRGGTITTLNAWSPVDFSNVVSNFTITNLNITIEALRQSNLNQAASGKPGVIITNLRVYAAHTDQFGASLP